MTRSETMLKRDKEGWRGDGGERESIGEEDGVK
jgi:hypothetical protein